MRRALTFDQIKDQLSLKGVKIKLLDENMIKVTYNKYYPKKDFSIKERHNISFTSLSTLHFDILEWLYDFKVWNGEKLIKLRDTSGFDLREELLMVGVKDAYVLNEDTNNVRVHITYCFIDRYGKFNYHGEKVYKNIGDKELVLGYILRDIKRIDGFVKCKNKI